MFEQELQDLATTVMTCCFEQRGSLMIIHFVDIGMGDNQSLANIEVLLHTSKCKGAFMAVRDDPRIGSEGQ